MTVAIELVKVIGITLSTVLIFLALYIRFWRGVDTTKLSADWALILIAGSGVCTLLYFCHLSSYSQLLLRANLVLSAICLYISALIIWFWGVLRSGRE